MTAPPIDNLPFTVAELLFRHARPGSPEWEEMQERLRKHMRTAVKRLVGRPVDPATLEMGDWISVRQTNLVVHQGIVVGDEMVVHATRRRGVIKTTLDKFCRGRTLALIERPEGLDGLLAAFNALEKVGNSYDPLFANCEHLASEAVSGAPQSQQVQIGVSVALLGVTKVVEWLRGRD